jgi:hypothetical protein
MDNEKITNNPERCLACLRSVAFDESRLDLFEYTYQWLLTKVGKGEDAQPMLRKMSELLVDQAVYVHGLLVDRKEEGMIQGGRN